MRADRAVEPTKSENITVTWRRSARSSGGALGALDVVAASTEARLAARVAAQSSNGVEELHGGAQATATPSSFRSSCRQAREDRLVYLILAECCLILPEAQAPQPDHNVHDGALIAPGRMIGRARKEV